MLTHHRTAPQALRIGRDKRHVIDAAEISDGGIKIVHQKRAAAKLRRGSILQCFKWGERRLLIAFKRDHDWQAVEIGPKQILVMIGFVYVVHGNWLMRSEEHTSELQSLMRISYAVFCLKNKKKITQTHHSTLHYNTT